ncbi:DUF3866 family protein [soil metagenome]
MGAFRQARIVAVTELHRDLVSANVEVDGRTVPAAGFPHMLGSVAGGDRVVVNMTGIDLGLGTGGVAFILWNLDGPGLTEVREGHIIKLRYTPWQTEVLATEGPESPHYETLEDVTSIGGMPVVVAGLHSQVAAIAAGLKEAAPSARVGYLMTDGGALPLAWSKLVRAMKGSGLVEVTCTSGHAFGGDLESVNLFSGLAALRVAGEADAVVVAPGPGSVGTGSALGFTAMEQGQALDAAGALAGRPVAALRISFADERRRHQGLSHHSATALTIGTRAPCEVALPLLPAGDRKGVLDALTASGIPERHALVEADGGPGLDVLGRSGVALTSMGRSVTDTRELFLAGAAAGRVAAGHLAGVV